MDTLRKILSIFPIKQRIQFVIIILLNAISAVMDTIATYMVLPFITVLMNQEEWDNKVLSLLYTLLRCQSKESFIIRYSLVIALFYVLTSGYKILCAYIVARFQNSNRHRISKLVITKTLNMSYGQIKRINSAEVQRLVSDDVNRVIAVVVQVINIITSLLTAGSLLVVLFALDKKITLFSILLILGVILLINKPASKRMRVIGLRITYTKTVMLKSVQQFFGGYKEILASERKSLVDKNYNAGSAEYSKAFLTASVLGAIPNYLSQGIIMSAIFVYISIIARWGADVFRMIPTLATFALAAVKLIPLAGGVSGTYIAIKMDIPAIDILYKFVYREPVDIECIDNDIKNDVGFVEGDIVLENVSFRFPDSNQYLFNNVSLLIKRNSSIALIGSTGAGKSTLVDLILGLEEVESGTIRIGNYDIKNNGILLRKNVGYIPQKIYLFDASIRENIQFGCEEYGDKHIWDCLKAACIDNFVKELPNGLDTICGENGVRFSGGQQQRIGIARALYSKPSILIFDEATSALDERTEADVVSAIDSLAGKKTIIIIAHRLSTIKKCDHVYEIKNGQIDFVR